MPAVNSVITLMLLYGPIPYTSMPISETEQQLVDTILSRTLDNWTATYLQATFAATLFAFIGGSIVWLWLWNSSRPPTTK